MGGGLKWENCKSITQSHTISLCFRGWKPQLSISYATFFRSHPGRSSSFLIALFLMLIPVPSHANFPVSDFRLAQPTHQVLKLLSLLNISFPYVCPILPSALITSFLSLQFPHLLQLFACCSCFLWFSLASAFHKHCFWVHIFMVFVTWQILFFFLGFQNEQLPSQQFNAHLLLFWVFRNMDTFNAYAGLRTELWGQ